VGVKDQTKLLDFNSPNSSQNHHLFYRHMLDFTRVKGGTVVSDEYLSTLDYIWRWDKDWFWCSQIFPGISHPLIRYLIGDHLLRSDLYKKFNDWVISKVIEPILQGPLYKLGLIPEGVSAVNQELVIQDIEVPAERAVEWVKDIHCKLVRSDLYGKVKLRLSDVFSTGPNINKTVCPIWCCPVQVQPSNDQLPYPLFPCHPEPQLYINVGFWDALEHPVATNGGNKTGHVNKALEKACNLSNNSKSSKDSSLNAIKTLYSNNYYSEEELYRIYDPEKKYEDLKATWDPHGGVRGWIERIK